MTNKTRQMFILQVGTSITLYIIKKKNSPLLGYLEVEMNGIFLRV